MTKNKVFRWMHICRELVCSLLFPPRCVICDEILSPEEKRIHKRCESKLHPIIGPVCMQCGRPLIKDFCASNEKGAYLDFYNTYEFCDECKSNANSAKKIPLKVNQYSNVNTLSSIQQGKALFLYRGAMKQTMYRFKYSNRREYAKFFAEYAAEQYGDWIRERNIQVIVPVPMYEAKQRRRGYNQAMCFARELSRQTGIPVEADLICRVKDTIPLKQLNRKERKNNLKNAFQKRKSIVQYSHILVVDDIYTTGATAQAVAKELTQKDASHVYFMSICIGEGM